MPVFIYIFEVKNKTKIEELNPPYRMGEVWSSMRPLDSTEPSR